MKNLKYLFMLFILLIIIPTSVLGESVKSHIVSIEEFRINDSEIIVEGYAFISHVDNWGQLGTNDGFGNLKTYVMAYVGSFNSAWKNPNNCKNSNDCYVATDFNGNVERSKGLDRNMFYSRCTSWGCHRYSELKSQVRDNINTSTYDNKCSGRVTAVNSAGNTVSDSECIYENVGFSQKIDLNKIFEKFSDKQVKFRIVSVNSDFTGNSYNALDSGLIFYNGVCQVNGVVCDSSSDVINTSAYELTLGGRSTRFYFDATEGIPRDKTYFKKISGVYFQDSPAMGDRNYSIISFGDIREINKCIKHDRNGNSLSEEVCIDTYSDIFFQLDSEELDCSDTHVDSRYCWKDEHGDWHGGIVYPEGYKTGARDVDYLAPKGFGTLTGEFSLKLNPLSRDIGCSDIDAFDDTSYVVDDISCRTKQSATINQCHKKTDVNTSIYVRVPSGYNSSSCGLGVTADKRYIIIDLKTDILINQSGNIGFRQILSSGTVRAGKGFEFSFRDLYPAATKDIMISPINYNALLTWIYAKWKYGENVPYYEYSTLYGGASSTCSSGISVYDLFDEYSGNSYYYMKPDGGMSSAMSLADASFNAVDSYVQDNYYKIKSMANTESLESGNARNAESVFNSQVKMVSCNSNYSGVGCSQNGALVDANGTWDLVEINTNSRSLKFKNVYDSDVLAYLEGPPSSGYVGAGKASWYVFTYKLPNAYISLADANDGYNYGDVAYENKAGNNKFLSLGNKYFISYKYSDIFDYNGFDWPFNLKLSNPSLVEGMNDWRVSGTCGVNVSDGYYKTIVPGGGSNCATGSCETSLLYKYRSISLVNPFPKFSDSDFADVAPNWKDWYWATDTTVRDKNRDRISYTYNNGVKYSVKFVKNGGTGSIPSIGDIVNCTSCSNSYGSLANFAANDTDPATSQFIKKYNWTSQVVGDHYCGLGRFSSKCDKLY